MSSGSGNHQGTKERKRLRKLMVMAVTLATMLVAAQVPALAHNVVLFHGYDKAVIGEEHFGVTVCDNERDGHYVWAELRYAPFGVTNREADGGDRGCDTEVFSIRHEEFRLCEENKGCTRWYPA
jgi:hypothetical protein